MKLQHRFHDPCGPMRHTRDPVSGKRRLPISTHFITVGKAVVPSPRNAGHTECKAVLPKKTYNCPTTAYPECWARQLGILVLNTDSKKKALTFPSEIIGNTPNHLCTALTMIIFHRPHHQHPYPHLYTV